MEMQKILYLSKQDIEEVNLSMSDIATAALIYAKAKQMGIGTELSM